jgi:hypothetical protein
MELLTNSVLQGGDDNHDNLIPLTQYPALKITVLTYSTAT